MLFFEIYMSKMITSHMTTMPNEILKGSGVEDGLPINFTLS